MNWRLKAAVQNLMGRLPAELANPLYYRLQRGCGGLHHPNPLSRLRAGLQMVCRLHQFGHSIESAVVLEVGTGHQLNLPLSLWLCGARQITTVDLNRYLQEQLVMNDIAYMRHHEAEVMELFAEIPQRSLFKERFAWLTTGIYNLQEVFALTNIRYEAPADAGRLALATNSFDCHISYTVLEHVPVVALKEIFQEGRRLLRPDGLFVHCIDFTDHFAHSDTTVPSVNFLQFSESKWDRLAGNRYMYHNRLRVDEFRKLLDELDLKVLDLEVKVDEAAVDILKQGFPLAERFQNKDCRTNAASEAWMVASPGCLHKSARL